MWQEIGVRWPKVDKYNSLQSRTKSLGLHLNLICNTTGLNQSMMYQPGVTGIALSNTIAPRVIGQGTDTRGIGRWA